MGTLGSKRLYIPNTNGVINSFYPGRAVLLLGFQICPFFLEDPSAGIH